MDKPNPPYPLPPSYGFHFSSKKGLSYFYNKDTKKSYWYDPELPENWAWYMTSENSPKIYINIITLKEQDMVPFAPRAIQEKVLPKLTPEVLSQYTYGYPSDLPSISTPLFPNPTFFKKAHETILKQLLKCAENNFKSYCLEHADIRRRKGESEERIKEAMEDLEFTMIDYGAGIGDSTAFMVENSPSSVVYAWDLFERIGDYYKLQLDYYNNSDLSVSYHQPSITEFSTRFSSNRNIIPIISSTEEGVHRLRDIDVAPWLIWIDGDLSGSVLKSLLDFIWDWISGLIVVKTHGTNSVMIGGGSWDLSEEIRSTVSKFAKEKLLSLHVEEGIAWTLNGSVIKESNNKVGDNFIPVDNSLVEQSVVDDDSSKKENRRLLWLAGIEDCCGNLSKSDEDLRNVIRSDEDYKEWINTGDNTRHHHTPLMYACKSRNLDFVKVLVEEFHADVNMQAEYSLYTPLHVAFHKKAKNIVAYLLEKGADPSLTNRHGERAIPMTK